jgi:diguanylate cyclase (GGDEF)-like protein
MTELTDQNWLIHRAVVAPDPAAFVTDLLRHLVARFGADLAALEVSGPGLARFYHVAADAAVDAAEARARFQRADASPGALTLVEPFAYRHTSGRLLVAPLRASTSEAAARDAASALQLLDLRVELAVASDEAARDPLTGLANRRAVDSALVRACAEATRYGGRTFSVVLVDLDNFKWFNDTYGHPSGDELLRQTGRMFERTVRTADLAARWGGDEFLILLPQTDPDSATYMLERVGVQLEEFLQPHRRPGVRLGFSAGIACFPDDGLEPDDLVRTADRRLYLAKPPAGGASRSLDRRSS